MGTQCHQRVDNTDESIIIICKAKKFIDFIRSIPKFWYLFSKLLHTRLVVCSTKINASIVLNVFVNAHYNLRKNIIEFTKVKGGMDI